MQVRERAKQSITIICSFVCAWIIACQFLFNTAWEGKRLFYMAGGLLGVVLLSKWKGYLCKKEEWIHKYFKVIFWTFLLVYAGIQFLIALQLRFEPIFDLEAIYGGAREWYQTGTFDGHKEYFYRFKNNLGGLGILYIANCFLANITQDFFLNGILINCTGLCITYALLILICKEVWGEVSAVICMSCIGLYAPFLFMGAVFYTDALSMPYVAGVIFLYFKMKKADSVKKKAVFMTGMGICCCIGAWVKGSIWILLVAVLIMVLLEEKKKVVLFCLPVALVMIVLLNALFTNYFYGKHLNDKVEQEKKLSVAHWIMMGLEGNGGYNPGDYEFSYGIENAKDRKNANIREIKSRIQEHGLLGMIKLFADKTVVDYGDATLGLSDFLDDNPRERGELHEYVLYDGKNYAAYQSYCRIGMLILLFSFLSVLLPGENRENADGVYLLLQLVMIGSFLFLMIWESGYRYLSSFFPVILLGGIAGAWKREKEKGSIISFDEQWKKRSVRIFAYSILFRMLIYFLFVCMMAIFGEYQEGIGLSEFLEAWKRWDAAHYLNIAENGYSGAVENGQHLFLVFYPLYPWLMKLVSFVTGDYRLAGILISVIGYGIGCVYFDKLMCMEYNEEISKNGLLLLSVFPFSFFFGAIMTESLFFALLAAFFYYLRKHSWGMIAFVGFLACMTKVQGMLLTFAVIAELFVSYHGILLIRQKKWKQFMVEIIGNGLKCVPMVAGVLVYLLVNFVVEADPFRFMYYQKNHWGNGLAPIWETISYVMKNALEGWHTSTGMVLWVPEFLLIAVYIAAIIYGIAKKCHPAYMVYLIAFFCLTYSSTWLISGGRYTLSALPLFLLGGKVITEKPKYKIPVIMTSFALMILYLSAYYQWKQIM